MNPPSDLQYMLGGKANSNSKFFYKDITSNNYEDRIKLDPVSEPKMDIRNQIPVHHLTQAVVKEFPDGIDAFEKADYEAEITKQVSLQKYQTLLQKEKDIGELVSKRFKKIRDDFHSEKDKLREELTNLIKDALKFSKKNNPMISMLPKALDHVNTSFNVSDVSLSRVSTRSVKKYESNLFLKELGIDLQNLSPDNIKIDIDKAYEFIKHWRTDRNINEVLRYKVVNEIMSVEEKRASQKVEKLNIKLKEYKHKKKENEKMKKELEEAMKKEEDKKDPKLKMKMKMLKSVQNHKKFEDKDAKGPKVEVKKTYTGEKGPRRRRKKKEEVNKPKTKVNLNSYEHVDKVLSFIRQSDNLSENPNVCKHFLNIKYNKKMDDLTKKMLAKNKLESVIDTETKVQL